MNWRPVTDLPDIRRPIIMRCSSGYIAPNDVAYVTGHFDDEWRPHAPWREYSGDALGEAGLEPTRWIYRDEFEKLVG